MTTTPVGNIADRTASATQSEEQDEQLQLVSFEVGDEEFAVDILAVQEIIRMTSITRVPQSPPSVEGVVNFRGQITPVVDLRKRFGLAARQEAEESRIIIVEIHGRVLGFTVDRVNEVLRMAPSVVDSAPSLSTSVDSEYIRGVGKLDNRLLILLDLYRLFGQAEIGHLEEAVDAGRAA